MASASGRSAADTSTKIGFEALGRRPDRGLGRRPCPRTPARGGTGCLSAPTQTTSLWKVPPAMAARDCWASTAPRRAVTTADGLGRLPRLAGGVGAVPGFEGVTAPDQQVDARRALVGAQADVVGRALVGQMRDGGQGVVDGESRRIGEQGVERRASSAACSSERCRLVSRLAGVKWTRPSAAVGARASPSRRWRPTSGVAEQAAAAKLGASFQARSSTGASEPLKPRLRRNGMSGRSCGGRTNCGRPRSASRFILSSPCSTAARGFDASPLFRLEARLPGLQTRHRNGSGRSGRRHWLRRRRSTAAPGSRPRCS